MSCVLCLIDEPSTIIRTGGRKKTGRSHIETRHIVGSCGKIGQQAESDQKDDPSRKSMAKPDGMDGSQTFVLREYIHQTACSSHRP